MAVSPKVSPSKASEFIEFPFIIREGLRKPPGQ
jgi:hypothetical protein